MKRSPLLPIFLIVLVDVMGLTIIIPLLPVYAETLGATPFVAGLLISVYGFCQLIAGPILGQISDRVGRRPVLLVSQVGTLIGFLILAYGGSLWLVFLSRIIDGLTAGNIAVAQAHISDVTTAKDRAKGFGVIGVAFSIGFLIGPALAGFLARFGYRPPILAAVAMSATSIAATWFLLPSKRPETPTVETAARRLPLPELVGALKSGAVGPLLWQFFSFTFMFSMFISGFPLFAVRRYTLASGPFDVQHISYVFALMGLLGIIVQGAMIGRLVEKFGEKALVLTGFVLMAAGVGAIAESASILILLAGVTSLSFGSSVLRPSITSLVSQSVGASQQGAAIGMTQSMMAISQILAPMLGGYIIGRGQLSLWAGAGAAIAAVGGILTLRHRRA